MGVSLGASGSLCDTFDVVTVFDLLKTFTPRMVMTACIFSKDEGKNIK